MAGAAHDQLGSQSGVGARGSVPLQRGRSAARRPLSLLFHVSGPGARVGVGARRDRAERPGARVLAALQAGVRAGCPGGRQPAGGGPLHQAARASDGAAHHRLARRPRRAAPARSARSGLGQDPRRQPFFGFGLKCAGIVLGRGMRIRNAILGWSGRGAITDARVALVEALVLAAALGYWRLGPEKAAGKASLLVACILLGALLALFGQTYQTGADTWELFANWAGLIVPWVIIGRFAALWILWLAIANVAIVLYFQVRPGALDIAFAGERALWTLFAFNTAALVAWELAARRIKWLDERWATRLLAIAGGTSITVLTLQAILDWRDASGMAFLFYPVWLGCAYAVYRRFMPDLFVLAGGCLSVIVVATAFLAKHLLRGSGEAAAFLLIAMAVIAMAAVCGWWLKQVAREART